MKVVLIVPFSRNFDSLGIGDEHEPIPVIAYASKFEHRISEI